jgi:hypothetical protein
MGMSQEKSLCILNKNVFFSFTKLVNRRAEQVLPRGWVAGIGTNKSKKAVGKGHERVNIV